MLNFTALKYVYSSEYVEVADSYVRTRVRYNCHWIGSNVVTLSLHCHYKTKAQDRSTIIKTLWR